MALNYTCDGCLSVMTKHAERGYLRKKHYCEECVEKVDTLLKKEIEERAKAVKKVTENISELREKFKLKNPTLSLPDEH